MKKKLLFLILLLIPFIVKADIEVFTPQSRIDDYQRVKAMVPYNDGYLALVDFYTISKIGDGTTEFLAYINSDGTRGNYVEIEEFFESSQILYDDNNIYIFSCSYYNDECWIDTYNKNLEHINGTELGDVTPLVAMNDWSNNFKPVTLKDGYLYFYNDYDYPDGEVIKIKTDFSSVEELEPTEDLLKSTLPEAYYFLGIYDQLDNGYHMESLTVQGDKIATTIRKRGYCPKSALDMNGCVVDDIIRIYDKDLNLIKEITLDDEELYSGIRITNATIIKNFLILNATYIVTPLSQEKAIPKSTYEGRYYIFDLEGNLLQTIVSDNEESSIFIETSDGFVTNKLSMDEESWDMGIVNGAIAFYSLTYYPIEATASHGSVAVRASALAGEVIAIEVTPQKGYTLSEIIVTDEEGNRLPVTNNSFVMGASKVTVRAIFVPENPNTGNFYVMLICLIAAFSGIFLVTQKKKLDFLK